MATEKEVACQSCIYDPNFAIICSFLEKFAQKCDLRHPTFADLQEMLENTQEIPQPLVELHIKLLRKARKSFSADRWEKAVAKFAHSYSQQDGWEFERFGYKKSRIEVKLRLLKNLLEAQFDFVLKFKNEINKLSPHELRVDPLGRDQNGQLYWCQVDPASHIRVYKEDQDEETWELVAKDRVGLVSLIDSLSSGEGQKELDLILNDDSTSQEIDKPLIIDTGQGEDNSSSESRQTESTKNELDILEERENYLSNDYKLLEDTKVELYENDEKSVEGCSQDEKIKKEKLEVLLSQEYKVENESNEINNSKVKVKQELTKMKEIKYQKDKGSIIPPKLSEELAFKLEKQEVTEVPKLYDNISKLNDNTPELASEFKSIPANTPKSASAINFSMKVNERLDSLLATVHSNIDNGIEKRNVSEHPSRSSVTLLSHHGRPSSLDSKLKVSTPGSKLDEIFRNKRFLEKSNLPPQSQPLPPYIVGQTNHKELLAHMSKKFNVITEDESIDLSAKKPKYEEKIILKAKEESSSTKQTEEPEIDEPIVEPLMLVKGEGSGKDCDSENMIRGVDSDEEETFEVSEAIEEPIIIFTGLGSGRDCEMGNLVIDSDEDTHVEYSETSDMLSEMIEEPILYIAGHGSGVECETGINKLESENSSGKSTTLDSVGESSRPPEKKTPKLWSIDAICSKETTKNEPKSYYDTSLNNISDNVSDNFTTYQSVNEKDLIRHDINEMNNKTVDNSVNSKVSVKSPCFDETQVTKNSLSKDKTLQSSDDLPEPILFNENKEKVPEKENYETNVVNLITEDRAKEETCNKELCREDDKLKDVDKIQEIQKVNDDIKCKDETENINQQKNVTMEEEELILKSKLEENEESETNKKIGDTIDKEVGFQISEETKSSEIDVVDKNECEIIKNDNGEPESAEETMERIELDCNISKEDHLSSTENMSDNKDIKIPEANEIFDSNSATKPNIDPIAEKNLVVDTNEFVDSGVSSMKNIIDVKDEVNTEHKILDECQVAIICKEKIPKNEIEKLPIENIENKPLDKDLGKLSEEVVSKSESCSTTELDERLPEKIFNEAKNETSSRKSENQSNIDTNKETNTNNEEFEKITLNDEVDELNKTEFVENSKITNPDLKNESISQSIEIDNEVKEKKTVVEEDKIITEKNKIIAEENKIIAEENKIIAEENKIIAEEDKPIVVVENKPVPDETNKKLEDISENKQTLRTIIPGVQISKITAEVPQKIVDTIKPIQTKECKKHDEVSIVSHQKEDGGDIYLRAAEIIEDKIIKKISEVEIACTSQSKDVKEKIGDAEVKVHIAKSVDQISPSVTIKPVKKDLGIEVKKTFKKQPENIIKKIPCVEIFNKDKSIKISDKKAIEGQVSNKPLTAEQKIRNIPGIQIIKSSSSPSLSNQQQLLDNKNSTSQVKIINKKSAVKSKGITSKKELNNDTSSEKVITDINIEKSEIIQIIPTPSKSESKESSVEKSKKETSVNTEDVIDESEILHLKSDDNMEKHSTEEVNDYIKNNNDEKPFTRTLRNNSVRRSRNVPQPKSAVVNKNIKGKNVSTNNKETINLPKIEKGKNVKGKIDNKPVSLKSPKVKLDKKESDVEDSSNLEKNDETEKSSQKRKRIRKDSEDGTSDFSDGKDEDEIDLKKPRLRGKVLTKGRKRTSVSQDVTTDSEGENELTDKVKLTKTLTVEPKEEDKVEKVKEIRQTRTKKRRTKKQRAAAKKEKKPVNVESDDDALVIVEDNTENGDETKVKTPSKSPKKTDDAKKKRNSTLLGLTERDLHGIDVDLNSEDRGIRQSRRLAQLKMKAQEEERKALEIALKEIEPVDKKDKKDKKKKSEKEDKTKGKKKKKQESEDNDSGEEEDSESKLKKLKENEERERRKKKKKDVMKYDINNPWKSSSGTSEEDEDLELLHYEEDEDEDNIIVYNPKSDHEFSPESDLEKDDSEWTPIKRARTAQKVQVVNNEASDDSPLDDVSCQKCSQRDHPEWILLCDKCNNGWHASCLRPTLMLIPEGDWFCPPCQHQSLVDKLKETLRAFERNSKRRENEDLRRRRLAYVGISLSNVLPGTFTGKKKLKKIERRLQSGSSDESSKSSSSRSDSSNDNRSSDSSETEEDYDEPIYQLRQRRQQTSSQYRFNEYDDLINSAIQDEMEMVKGAGNQGRGKDIETIIQAEKEEEKQKLLLNKENANNDGATNNNETTEQDNSGEVLKQKTNEDFEDDEEEGEGWKPPVVPKKPKFFVGKKKSRKLNSLEIDSNDDGSDEDFKGSSNEEEESDFSGSDESDFGGKWNKSKHKPVRRSTRARQSRIDSDFINDDTSSDEPRKKKKRKEWTESESSESDETWGRKKNKNKKAYFPRPKTKKGKMHRGRGRKILNESDSDEVKRQKPKKPKIRYGLSTDEDDDEINIRRTRGKQINYQESGSDSDVKPKRIIDSDEEEFKLDKEYVEESADEKISGEEVVDEEEDEAEKDDINKERKIAKTDSNIINKDDDVKDKIEPAGELPQTDPVQTVEEDKKPSIVPLPTKLIEDELKIEKVDNFNNENKKDKELLPVSVESERKVVVPTFREQPVPSQEGSLIRGMLQTPFYRQPNQPPEYRAQVKMSYPPRPVVNYHSPPPRLIRSMPPIQQIPTSMYHSTHHSLDPSPSGGGPINLPTKQTPTTANYQPPQAIYNSPTPSNYPNNPPPPSYYPPQSYNPSQDDSFVPTTASYTSNTETDPTNEEGEFGGLVSYFSSQREDDLDP